MSNPSIPVKTDDGRVIGKVIDMRDDDVGLRVDAKIVEARGDLELWEGGVYTKEDVDALIVEGRSAVRDARVAARDQRTPPWKTPAGKAAKARKRRNKAQRNARKANR